MDEAILIFLAAVLKALSAYSIFPVILYNNEKYEVEGSINSLGSNELKKYQ